MALIGQLAGDGDHGLVVVFQLGIAVLFGAVPGLELVVVRSAGGQDLVVIAAVDRLGLVVHRVGIIDLAPVGGGDLILQRPDVAQKSRVDKAQGIHVPVVVGGDGVAVGQIGDILVIGVVAQIGIDRPLQGAGGRRVHIGLGPAVPPAEEVGIVPGVHDGGLGPVAVKGHVGDGQGGLGLGSGIQGDKALHIGPVFKGIQIFLRRAVQGDGDSDLRRAPGGDGDGLAGDAAQEIGQLGHLGDILAAQLLGDFLPVGLDIAAQGIGQLLLRQAVDQKAQLIHAVLPRVVPQGQLGPGAVHGGEIGLGRGGGGDVDAARALLPGRIGGSARHDQIRRAHEQVAHQLGLVHGALRQILLLHILLDDGHSPGDKGGGHGGAALGGIAAAHRGRLDIAAGGGDVGLEGQLRGDAPGGEVGHLTGGGVLHRPGEGRDRQLPLLRRQAQEIGPVGLGDESGGQVIFVQLHIQQAGLVVIDHHTGGTGSLGGLFFVLIVDISPGDQGDLVPDVQVLVIGALAEAGDDHILQALPRQGAEGLGACVHAAGGAVLGGVVKGHLALARGEIIGIDGGGLFHAGHREGGRVAGGACHRAIVRVGGEGMALADPGAQGGAVFVAGRDGKHHARVHDALEDLRDPFVPLRRAEAAGGAQAHVDDIGPQGDRVVGRRQDVIPGGAVGAIGAEDLHSQDLRLGRDARHVGGDAPVARGDARHMGPVVPGIAGGSIRVVVGIVKGKGDLPAAVNLGGGDAGHLFLGLQVLAGQDLGHILLGEGRVGGRGPEQGMGDLQTAVHDGDDHSLSLVAGGVFQPAQLHRGGLHIRSHLEHRRGIGRSHPVQRPDLLQLAIGHPDGEAGGHGGIGAQDLHRRPVQNLGGDGLLNIFLLAQQGGLVFHLAAAGAVRDHHGLGLQHHDGRDLFRGVDGVGGLESLQAAVPQLLDSLGIGRFLGRPVPGQRRQIPRQQHGHCQKP